MTSFGNQDDSNRSDGLPYLNCIFQHCDLSGKVMHRHPESSYTNYDPEYVAKSLAESKKNGGNVIPGPPRPIIWVMYEMRADRSIHMMISGGAPDVMLMPDTVGHNDLLKQYPGLQPGFRIVHDSYADGSEEIRLENIAEEDEKLRQWLKEQK